MPASISFTLNGKSTAVEVDPNRPLLDILREDIHLTGTKYGCGEGACGACSVLANGKRIFSCSTPMSEVAGKSITTIEGLANGGTLHPLQQAFLEERGFQCGYCTAGMIMNATALLNAKPNPTEAEIREEMNGNLCRCCAHTRIIHAIHRATELAKA